MTTTRTLGNVGAGVVVGTVASFLPLVTLVAALLGGGVAGYLERAGVERGALVGAATGVLLALVASVATTVALYRNVGAIPFENLDGVPPVGLLLAGALTAFGVAVQSVVAAVGGALGAVVEADLRRTAGTVDGDRNRRLLWGLGSALVGLLVFVGVGLGLTALLDPYVWPSMLVGLPVGAVAGVAAAVLGHHLLTGRATRRGGRPG